MSEEENAGSLADFPLARLLSFGSNSDYGADRLMRWNKWCG